MRRVELALDAGGGTGALGVEHTHPEAARAPGHGRADPPEPDQPEGGAGDAHPEELGRRPALPLAAPRERVYAALVQPEPWWGSVRVAGVIAVGERPVLDFGQFGKFRIEVLAAEPPHYLAYRRPQGIDDPERMLDAPSEGASTLVELHLDAAPEGTLLRQSETGFGSLTTGDVGIVRKRADQVWGITLGMLQQHLRKP